MNWLGLLSFGAARDPELAPHAYLMYLLLWTLVVGLFVLFLFPMLGKTVGFVIIRVLIFLFVYQVWYFIIIICLQIKSSCIPFYFQSLLNYL